MFKQVFARFFAKPSTPQSQDNSTSRYDQSPIYAIPTISSCFQSHAIQSSAGHAIYSNPNVNITDGSNSNNSNKSMSSAARNSTNKFLCSLSQSSGKNYNDSQTRQIYIAPHCIRYTNSTLDDTIYRIDDESLNEIAAEILDSENMPPKLQIVFYDNTYFAINNSHLQIYKQLQLCGLITHVQADLISVEAIPVRLRDHLLQTPSHLLELDTLHSDLMMPTDEEVLDEQKFEGIKRNGANSSSTSSANALDSASDNETNQSFNTNTSKLVDETYEFGECENCIESDHNENEDELDDDDDEDDFDIRPELSKIEANYYDELNLEFNLMTKKKIISNEISKLRSVNKVKNLDKHTNRKNKTTSQKSSLKQSSQVLNETNAEEKCTVVNLDHLLLKEQEDSIQENINLIESDFIGSRVSKNNVSQLKEKNVKSDKLNIEKDEELENLLEKPDN